MHARALADRPDDGQICPTGSAVSATFYSIPLHLHYKGAESVVLLMVSLWNGLGLLRQGEKLATRLRVPLPRLRIPTLVGELQALCEQSGPTAPTASPQASLSPVLPQGQSGLGSWSPVPRNLTERNQILERIASQGLDKTP